MHLRKNKKKKRQGIQKSKNILRKERNKSVSFQDSMIPNLNFCNPLMRVKTLTWLSFWNEAQANECVCVCATKNLRHYQMATVASHTLSCKQSNAKLTWGSCGFVCGVFEKTSWRNPSTKNIRVRFLSPPLWRLVAVQATYQSTSTGLVKALASTKREAAKPCECLNSN